MFLLETHPVSVERFMVTGGAGFIGSHLADLLASRGVQVMILDDFNDYYSPVAKRRNLQQHLTNSRVRIEEADIRDKRRVLSLVQSYRPQVLVHLAARAGVRPSVESPELYETTNVLGTLNLLEAARVAGVERFVFGSSSSVYGVNTQVPFSETDPLLLPASPYAATKIAGEALCNSYHHVYGLEVVSLRFFTVFGPRQRPDLAIHKFAALIREGRAIPLYGDGTSCRDYTYVSDIVAGIDAAIRVPVTRHEIFNLGNGSPVGLLEMVRILERVLGTPARIDWQPEQPGDVPRTYADISKAHRMLGYAPKIALEHGIREMVAWLDRQACSNAR